MVEMITYDPEIFNETWNKISNVTEKRMKQYKLNTHLISGYRKDEEIPKEVKDDLISEGCPESWFSPVEEEVQEGQYWEDTTGSVLRVNNVRNNYADCTFIDDDSTGRKTLDLIKQTGKLLDDDAVEEMLIAEAKRRGLIGSKIKSANPEHHYLGSWKCPDGEIEYYADVDGLTDENGWIYYQGEFAEIVGEPIQINGYETEIDDSPFVKVGCTNVSRKVFKDLDKYSTNYDLSIYREGEDITKQIKQIADNL